MLTYKEFVNKFLNESPIAHSGDFKGNKVKLGLISTIVLDKYWTKIPLIKSDRLDNSEKYEVYVIDNSKRAFIGYKTEDGKSYKIVSELFLSLYHEIDKFGYKKVLQTSEVRTDTVFRGFGFATSLYLSLINAGYTLISDYNQFDGARNLWKGLQGYKIKLDVFDEVEDEVTKEHKIIHTNIDNLDKEWSKFPSQNGDRYLFIVFK